MSVLARVPITLRAPLLVALLMIVVSVIASERVMRRLIETQERQLVELSSAYLDGLSSSLSPHILREDMWEVYDALQRSKTLYSAARPLETVVIDASQNVIAASDPLHTPSLEPVSIVLKERLIERDFAIDEALGRAFVRRDVVHQGVSIGGIYAVLDIRHLLQERSEVVTTLILSNALFTLILAAFGYAVVRHMVAPVRVLTSHLRRGLDGAAEPIPAVELPSSGSEARRLFDAYNRLVAAETQREGLARRLAEEETLASLGRLASGMAHEINNPLGGLFNALHSIKRHGERPEVREASVELIERGLVGIRDVVEATLETYRPDKARSPLEPADIEDMRLLAQPEIKRKRLHLDWRNTLAATVDAPAAPVRQIVLNLLLNACAAAPQRGRIGVAINADGAGSDRSLSIVVEDDGAGLPEAAAKLLRTPNPSPPIGEGGLGLWMIRRLTTELDGEVRYEPRTPSGARIEVTLPLEREADAKEVDYAAA